MLIVSVLYSVKATSIDLARCEIGDARGVKNRLNRRQWGESEVAGTRKYTERKAI